MNILVVGGGGRENAIIYSLKKSKRVDKVYCIPGNGGISQLAQCYSHIRATDIEKIVEFVQNHPDIAYTVVAPDDPLALGLVNALQQKGFRAFGPTKEAAIIESSKAFSKDLMKKYNIPTAQFETFDDAQKALAYVKTAKYPLVVKADGLALGKGVIICDTAAQAAKAIKDIMIDAAFGKAGNTIVVEEFLKGFEVSVLAFTDGKTIVPMLSSQDHKRALDGDMGLNTGGMGTFCPSQKYTKQMADKAYKTIFLPTIEAMNKENRRFSGVLYFGLMIDNDDIKVLEYNARFGDPETQVILPLLKTDLSQIFESIIDGELDKINIEWSEQAAVCVIMASGGYPTSYKTGYPITIGDVDSDILLFYAGVKEQDGVLVTSGGRVLGVTAIDKTLEAARNKAYKNVQKIDFEGKHYRTDIYKG